MLIALIAVLAGASAGLVIGRVRSWALSPVSLRALPLAVGAISLALVGRWTGGIGLAVAAYAVLAGFAIINWRHPGMVVAGGGLLANLVVTVVNGGMPVSGLGAISLFGPAAGPGHHNLTAADHLTGLADVIRLPALGSTVSAGDLLVALGGALAACAVTAGTARRRPATAA